MQSVSTPRAAKRTILVALIAAALLLPASPVLVLSWHSAPAVQLGGKLTPGTAAWGQAQLRLAQLSLWPHVGPGIDRYLNPLVSVASSGPHLGWVNISLEASPGPSLRYAPSATWDGADGYVLLYGGIHTGTTSSILSDTWSYLNGTWRNLTGTLTGTPPPLAASSMVYDPVDHEVLMFGGAHSTGAAADLGTTWAYHAGIWTNLTGTVGTAPSARIAAGLVFDSTDGNVVLFGGQGNSGPPLQDTWTFHAGQWTNITATAPTNARLFIPQVADDPADHGVLAFGIDSYNASFNAPYRPVTFLFSGGMWHNLTPTLSQEPPMIYLGGLANFGPSTGLILFTGYVVNGLGQFEKGGVVWQYLGGLWTNLTGTLTTTPGGIALPGWATTPDGAVVQFGGEPNAGSANASAFTWVLSLVPNVGVTVSKSAIDVGQSVTASSSVAGGVDPISLAWSFGDGGTGSTSVVTHSYAAAGLYLASVTATDLVGHVETGSAAVQVNPDPTASIVVAPSSVHSGTGATLVAIVTGGTAPFTYAWTLGDGATASTGTVNHTYSNTGTVSVTVQVTDAAGKTVSSTTPVSVGSPTTAVNLTSGTGLGLLIGVIVLAIVAVAFAVMWMRARSPRPPPTPPSSASGGP